MQSLVQDAKAVAIKPEDLQAAASLVGEAEQGTASRIYAEVLMRFLCEPIRTLRGVIVAPK